MNSLIESMKTAIDELKSIDNDIIMLDALLSIPNADTTRIIELRKRQKKIEGSMNTTNKHNIQQVRECVKALSTLDPNCPEYAYCLNRKQELKKEIKIYRDWLRRTL